MKEVIRKEEMEETTVRAEQECKYRWKGWKYYVKEKNGGRGRGEAKFFPNSVTTELQLYWSCTQTEQSHLCTHNPRTVQCMT